MQSLPAFKRHLNTLPVSLPHPLATHHPTRPDSLIDFGAIQVLYLLTYLKIYRFLQQWMFTDKQELP